MRTIYKYPIEITDVQTLILPKGSRLLSVKLDPRGTPCIWASVDTDRQERVELVLRILGTGNPMPDELTEAAYEHLGSFVQGAFVWHIFAERPATRAGRN